MKFSIKDFFNKCDQIRSFLRIRSHLLKKSLMENFSFCAVTVISMKDEKLLNGEYSYRGHTLIEELRTKAPAVFDLWKSDPVCKLKYK